MTSPRRFEQDLSALLADVYLAGMPVYRDDLVRQVARTPQRPAWTFPGRWLPMELVTTRVPTTRLPMRQLGVLALIAILLAAMFAAYIGSRQTRLPEPFGRAANGVVAYSDAGDIVVADPATGQETALIAGPEHDLRPVFSRDGATFAFERRLSDGSGRSDLYMARTDGSGLRKVTAEPVLLAWTGVGDPYSFSPDGRMLVVAGQRGSELGLRLIASDGSEDRALDLSAIADRVSLITEPTFRPPDGKEIMFVGTDQTPTNGGPGLYAVDLTTGAVRTIVEADRTHELDLATWSPDGTRVSYNTWDITVDGLTVRVHIVAADGIGDRPLPMPTDGRWQVGGAWSNDGTRLHVVRGNTSGWADSRPAIVPADGSSPGIEIPYHGAIQGSCCYSWEWSPDDGTVIGKPVDSSGLGRQQVVIDVATRSIRSAPWASTDEPSIQRVAP